MDVKVTFMPNRKTVEVKLGATIMQAAWKAGVHIRTRCGQQAGCLMCKVTVDEEHHVMPKSEKERRKLADESVRLACQTKVVKDVTVNIPEDPLKRAIRLQLEEKEDDFW